jgi:hypothetical protein
MELRVLLLLLVHELYMCLHMVINPVERKEVI